MCVKIRQKKNYLAYKIQMNDGDPHGFLAVTSRNAGPRVVEKPVAVTDEDLVRALSDPFVQEACDRRDALAKKAAQHKQILVMQSLCRPVCSVVADGNSAAADNLWEILLDGHAPFDKANDVAGAREVTRAFLAKLKQEAPARAEAIDTLCSEALFAKFIFGPQK